MDTLQTQWSWLLQITKCIHVHLKENAAYSQVGAFPPALALVRLEPGEHLCFCLPQFFKEANETYSKLQKEHESIRSKFTCNKNTPLENLTDLLRNLEVLKSGDKVFLCSRCTAAHCCVGGLRKRVEMTQKHRSKVVIWAWHAVRRFGLSCQR